MAEVEHRGRKRRHGSITSMSDGERKKLKSFDEREDSLRTLATCKICFRLLYEPYSLTCGHTHCYSCLCRWFEAPGRKKTCPDCRGPVTMAPASAFTLREMVRDIIKRPELLPEGETMEEHERLQTEEASIVDQDRANTDPARGGLFKGRFKSLAFNARRTHVVHDPTDHVDRCPQCMWELEGHSGQCGQCGLHFGPAGGRRTLEEARRSQDMAYRDELSTEDDYDDDDEDLDGDLDMDDAEFDENIAGMLGEYDDDDTPASHLLPPRPYRHRWLAQVPPPGHSDEEICSEDSDDDDHSTMDSFISYDEAESMSDSGTSHSSRNSTRTATRIESPAPAPRVRQRRVIEDDEDEDEQTNHIIEGTTAALDALERSRHLWRIPSDSETSRDGHDSDGESLRSVGTSVTAASPYGDDLPHERRVFEAATTPYTSVPEISSDDDSSSLSSEPTPQRPVQSSIRQPISVESSTEESESELSETSSESESETEDEVVRRPTNRRSTQTQAHTPLRTFNRGATVPMW